MLTFDVAIIGGGVVGLSSAWRIAQTGAKVVLLEKSVCGAGASAASMGALMPYNNSNISQIAVQQRQSLQLYPTFAKELFYETGQDIRYTLSGRVQPLYSQHQWENAKRSVELLSVSHSHKTANQSLSLITQQEAKELEPHVQFSDFGALLCQQTAWMSPPHLVSALRAACLRAGVYISENTNVISMLHNTAEVSLSTSCGVFIAQKVVVAAGAWTQNLLPGVPVTPLRGHCMVLNTSQLLVRHLVRAQGLYIIQKGRQLWVGASKDKEAGFVDELDENIINNMLNKLNNILPNSRNCEIEKKWLGFRPMAAQPMLSQIETHPLMYLAAGHGGIGICMAPLVGEQVKKMVIAA